MNLVLTKEQPLKRLVLAPPHDTPVPKPDMPTVLNADSLFVPLKDIPVPTGAALAKVMLLKYVVTEEAIRVLAGVFGSIIVAFADPPNIERAYSCYCKRTTSRSTIIFYVYPRIYINNDRVQCR